MKNIEINSDKTTVLSALFVLALMLLMLLSNIYDLLRHGPIVHHGIDIWTYIGAGVVVWAAVIFSRDGKIRKAYPYGVAGAGLMALTSVMTIALHWAKAGEMQSLRYTVLAVIDIMAAGLVLVEGVRWFRSVVKIAERRAE